jgi:hypothetical protein
VLLLCIIFQYIVQDDNDHGCGFGFNLDCEYYLRLKCIKKIKNVKFFFYLSKNENNIVIYVRFSF